MDDCSFDRNPISIPKGQSRIRVAHLMGYEKKPLGFLRQPNLRLLL